MALSDLLKDLEPRTAEALTQITETLRQEFDRKLSATRDELGLEAPAEGPAEEPVAAAPPEPAAAIPADILDPLEELKHAVVAVDTAGSQGEVLNALVAGCARFSSRCAVFLVRDDQVSGWTSHGFSSSDEEMRSLSFTLEPNSSWARLSAGEGALALEAADCGQVTDQIGADAPEMGFLLPFVLNNQTAAGVYCDRVVGDEPPNVAALQLVTFIASQVLENLPVRDRDSTSTLRLAGTAVAEAVVAAPEVAEPEAPAAEPEPEPEPPEAVEAIEPAPVDEGGHEIEAAAEAPAIEDHAPPIEPAPSVMAEPEPIPEPTDYGAPPPVAEPPAEAGPATEVGDTEEPAMEDEPPAPAILSGATTQVVPPVDLEGPGWAFTGAAAAAPDTGEDAQHEEARRLARLLVTEVKLYNEELVEQGRKQGNVYSVLKEDIDRSRQIFEDRIAPEVRAGSDYFHEALVRILAGGDPAVLGA